MKKLNCCGIIELEDICDMSSKESVFKVADSFFNEDYKSAFIIFTDINKKNHGESLRAFIKKNKLGSVTKQRAKKNPNSGNMIHLFVWHVNENALLKWYKKNLKMYD